MAEILFQFPTVQFKVQKLTRAAMAEILFQFPTVQFKDFFHGRGDFAKRISIPHGTIQSRAFRPYARLRRKISIPHGTIQSHAAQGRIEFLSYFNSPRYNSKV